MPRRREVAKREIQADPKYNNKLVAKFVNFLTHAEPATLAQYGLGAGAIYVLVRLDPKPKSL